MVLVKNSTVNKIAIVPSFSTPDLLIAMLSSQIEIKFNMKVVILKPIKEPLFALDKNRSQYNAVKILDRFEKVYGSEYIKTLMILDVDLFIPIFTHLFGEAKLGGNIALISTNRLKDSASLELLCERAVKVALHELGHLYSLTHCMDDSCLMHFAGDISELDTITTRFCHYCSHRL